MFSELRIVLGDKLTETLPDWLLVGQHCKETWSDVIIVAHILVLLLTPDQLSVGIFLCLCSDQVKWKWRDLIGETKYK